MNVNNRNCIFVSGRDENNKNCIIIRFFCFLFFLHNTNNEDEEGEIDKRRCPYELSRLPVKFLIQSKTVAKSWEALISDPYFSKLHLKRSACQYRNRFMFLHDYSQRTLAYEAPQYGISSETNKPLDADNKCDECVDFLAYCDGLFCVNNADDEMFLWNPSTRVSKKISGSIIEFPGCPCTWASVFFGLGYHSTSDDYKLVRIALFDSVDFETEVKIYSRINNTWKRIKDFPYDFPVSRPGVFACGNLYWMACDSAQCYSIVVLKLEDEDYELIKLPDFGPKFRLLDIGALGENLCCYSKLRYEYEIWILEEYLKAKTWKMIKITTSCLENIDAYIYFEPLCLLGADTILIRAGPKKFVIYYTKHKLCWEVFAPNMIMETRIVSFLESLLSPN